MQWQHAVLMGEPFSNSPRVAARGRTAASGTDHPSSCSSTPLSCSWKSTAGNIHQQVYPSRRRRVAHHRFGGTTCYLWRWKTSEFSDTHSQSHTMTESRKSASQRLDATSPEASNCADDTREIRCCAATTFKTKSWVLKKKLAEWRHQSGKHDESCTILRVHLSCIVWRQGRTHRDCLGREKQKLKARATSSSSDERPDVKRIHNQSGNSHGAT